MENPPHDAHDRGNRKEGNEDDIANYDVGCAERIVNAQSDEFGRLLERLFDAISPAHLGGPG